MHKLFYYLKILDLFNSLNCCKTNQNQSSLGSILNLNSIDNGLSGITAIHNANQTSASSNNGNANGSGYTLTHKRSDLIVEWTDSVSFKLCGFGIVLNNIYLNV